jgi:cytochrome c553
MAAGTSRARAAIRTSGDVEAFVGTHVEPGGQQPDDGEAEGSQRGQPRQAAKDLRGAGREEEEGKEPMNRAMDQICAGYSDDQLDLLAEFLGRTTTAGRDATDELRGPPGMGT